MFRHKRHGFGLIEMLAVLAALVALAAVMVPVVGNELDAGQSALAQADLDEIANGLMRYTNDTTLLPCGKGGRPEVALLTGEGPIPTGLSAKVSCPLQEYLSFNRNGAARWRGPYCPIMDPDPWGQAYVVTVIGYQSHQPVWVLSAGPNRKIDTPLYAHRLKGDDLGVRIDPN